ncbi:MAG: O-antigen ligase family protein [Patescibacteria group bacterium]
MAELFIGSHGYLLSFSFGHTQVSLRVALFIILLAFSLIHIRRIPLVFNRLQLKRLVIMLAPLAVFVVFAFLRGLYNGYNFGAVFFDANAYFYFALVLPLLIASRGEEFTNKCLGLLLVAAGYIAVKTILVFYFFTHPYFQFFDLDLYVWLRDSKVGEFTPTGTGLYRIFIQSQLYVLVAWTYLSVLVLRGPIWLYKRDIAYLGLLAAALIVSFSRSFWLGWIAALGVIIFYHFITKKFEFGIRYIAAGGASVLLGYLLLVGVIVFPFPGFSSGAHLELDERLTASDAAASSRWNLLAPLWHAIEQHELLGSGFGSSVTYISNDPRVRASSASGTYTTTAFEWGYLDMWLKLGLLGVAAYGVLIVTIFWGAVKTLKQAKTESFGLLFGLIAVLFVNIGSPYLNHPLGIGLILLSALVYGAGLTKAENSAINKSSTLLTVPGKAIY